MPFKTFAAGEVGLASDVNTYLMQQSVMQFLNTTDRNAALPTPIEGMVAYLQTPNHFTIYNGSSWVVQDIGWNTYTPTFTNFTLGNGTLSAAYYRVGNLMTAYVYVVLGTTSAVTGVITASLPVNMVNNLRFQGVAKMLIAGTTYAGSVINAGAGSTMQLYAHGSAAAYVNMTVTTATIPGTWASTSAFFMQVTYEVA